MARAAPKPIHLYAAVPAEQGAALEARMRGFSVLAGGTVAAIFGCLPDFGDEVRAALWHNRIVGLALETCSSVVPFRLGIELRSRAELCATVSLNAQELSDQLARFRGRVEMGLKVRLATLTADEPLRVPSALERVRAFAPQPEDRCERLVRSGQDRILEGCYLISRQSVAEFWRVLDAIRRLSPELALLGSGPWAAYSFCNVPLRLGVATSGSFLER
jgi:hypothetical protein